MFNIPFPLLTGAICCVGSVVHADQVIQSFNDLAKPVGFWAPEGTPLQECFAPESGNMTGNWETIFTSLAVTERLDLQSAVSHYVASQAQGLGPTSVGYIRGPRFRSSTYRSFAKNLGATDRPVYLSFLVKMVGNNAEGAVLFNGYGGSSQRKGIHLGDDGAPGDLAIINNTMQQQLGDVSLTGTSSGKRVELALNDGNVHLVVGKITFGATDTFQLWIDPDVASEQALLALAPAITYSGYDHFTNDQLTNLGLEMVRDPSANISFDNFKLSDSPNAFDVVYQAAHPVINTADVGTVLNQNPTFDLDLNGWNTSKGGIRVSPGLIGGLAEAGVRLQGEGDPSGDPSGHFGQNLPVGAKDFELTTWIAPVAKNRFANYTGTFASGANGDRLFQMLIMGGDGTVPAEAQISTQERSKIMINLAYFPAGVAENGTEGFYIKNQSTWVRLAQLGTITGSVDANGDGILSAAEGDTVLPYQIRIKGTGFSTGSRSYVISLYNPRTETTVATSSLTSYSGLNPSSSTPSAIVFTTNDTEIFNGSSIPLTTPFWIDDTAYYATSTGSLNLTLLSPSPRVLAVNDFNGASSLTIRNDTADQAAAIYSVISSSPRFKIDGLPVVIPANASATLPVRYDATGLKPGDGHAAELSFTTSSTPNPIRTFTMFGGRVSPASLALNGDFEQPLLIDSFSERSPFWGDFKANGIIKVPSIHASSGSSVYLGPETAFLSQRIYQKFSSAVVDFRFAVRPAATGSRQASLLIQDSSGTGTELINIKYEDGKFWAFSQDGAAWNPIMTLPLTASIDSNTDGDFNDAGESWHTYRGVLTMQGLGTTAASYSLEIYEAAGAEPIGSSGSQSYFRNSGANLAPFNTGPVLGQTVTFSTRFGNCPGWWVDDVNVRLILTAEPKVAVNHQYKVSQGYTIEWFSNRKPVVIERSLDLKAGSWEVVSPGNNDEVFTDTSVPPGGKAFYRLRGE